MASPLAEFEPVLRAFLGADNTARTAANQYLVQLRNSQPDTLLLSLLQVCLLRIFAGARASRDLTRALVLVCARLCVKAPMSHCASWRRY